MKRGVAIFWSIFVAAAFFRVWGSFGASPPDVGDCLGQNMNGKGIVSSEPARTETGQMLVISVEESSVGADGGHASASCSADFLIRMKARLYPRFSDGQRVVFSGKLLRPANFSSESGRIFDYRGYLARQDIYYEMKSAAVSPVDADKRTTVSSLLYAMKARFVASLEDGLGEPHAALAAGLVVGEKAALGKDLLDDFRAVGLIHIVVLSGYNITIVADALRRLLSFLPRVWGIAAGAIGIVLFGILVGGGATVVRSCFMAGIALSAGLIRRDYSVARALVFAGLVMVIQSPMILLHDPSFQLSFLATMGLVLLAGPLESRFTLIPDVLGMRGIVASTVATQIFVSPYILYMMGQISVIGMVVNILVLPFIPATMFLVFLTGIGGMMAVILGRVFGWVAHLLLSYELFMVQSFARLPFASAHIPAFSIWWVAGFYGVFGMGYLFLGCYYRKGNPGKR